MNTSSKIKISRDSYKILKNYPKYSITTLINYAIFKARQSMLQEEELKIYPIEDQMTYHITLSNKASEAAKIYGKKLYMPSTAFISLAINTMILNGDMPRINETLIVEKFILDSGKFISKERD